MFLMRLFAHCILSVIIHNGIAKAAGESQVIVFSNPKDVHTGIDEAYGPSAIQLAVYIAGERFVVKN